MKPQEAIERFKERLLITDYKEQIPEYYEAMETAIEALDKQVPTEPYIQSDGYANGTPVWEHTCPRCEYNFEENTPKYCPECGQAIDWSEEDD